MKNPVVTRRSLALLAVIVPLAVLFLFVVLRAGPLAPVPVTVALVESGRVAPGVFGIGTVEARYEYRIGPTFAGRVMSVNVEVGDEVRRGQVLGEMDPVDFDARIASQEAALSRTEAVVLAGEARVSEAGARQRFAEMQADRYRKLLEARTVSAEEFEARSHELNVAVASLAAVRASLAEAREDLSRARADREVLLRLRANLRLVAPVDGLVTARAAEPGTTVLAGQTVVELVDPRQLWVHLRVDQSRAVGLRARLRAIVVLRSQGAEPLPAQVLRVEPRADAVTEEILAKVVFDHVPTPLPPIGELAEITVELDAEAATLVVQNASLQRRAGVTGVWLVEDGALRFAPVVVGAGDLDGRVQVLEGLNAGDQTVVFSPRALHPRTRVKIVEILSGGSS